MNQPIENFNPTMQLNSYSARILQFLSRASSELGTSLNWQETLDQLCRVVTPDLAEHCSVWYRDGKGIFTEHKRPDLQMEISDLIEIEISQVIKTGQARLKINDDSFTVTVPMRLKNNMNGIIVLINFKKAFDQVDLAIAEELAHRAAMVLDHAKVYENLKTAEEHLQMLRNTADNASKIKSLFLANMSHEIRTPLTAILGFLDLILSNQEQKNTQSEDLANRVRANGAHLLKLIDQILDLSKIESGKIEIFSEKVNLGELLKEVNSTLILQANKKNIALEFKLMGSVPSEVQTDPMRLKQILINILGNAIKFTDSGKVCIVVSYGPENSQLQFKISDTGIGLTVEQRGRIFNPFIQGDISHTKKFGGTGLGLILSRKFAQQMGGDLILLDSVLGSGTSFEVKVQALSEANTQMMATVWKKDAAVKPSNKIEEVISLAGADILLAEDSVDNQMIIKMILTKAGAKVDIAADGQEALKKASQKNYDIILMDIQLPYMNGHLVCQSLREKLYTGPIIALTAHALKEERNQSFQAGCNAHLTKPIDRQLLLSTIKSYL